MSLSTLPNTPPSLAIQRSSMNRRGVKVFRFNSVFFNHFIDVIMFISVQKEGLPKKEAGLTPIGVPIFCLMTTLPTVK